MTTPPSSIEEVAKRVRLLQMTYVLPQEVAIYRDEIARLAPQLAEWVEKALLVIELLRYGLDSTGLVQEHRGVEHSDVLSFSCYRCAATKALSSLAAEGTTE